MNERRQPGNGAPRRDAGGEAAGGTLSANERLLADYIERMNSGDAVSIEAIRRDHPDHAEELIENLRLYQQVLQGSPAPEALGALGGYTLRRQIGRGGMGVVYEAWERSMDRRVALKVLPAGLLAGPRAVARFRREAKLAGRLNHPNVVSVYGMGVEEGVPCFAMEFVEGETLEKILARSRPPDSREQRRSGSRIGTSIARVFSALAPTRMVPPPAAGRRTAEASEAAESGGAAAERGRERRQAGFQPPEIDLKHCLRMAELFAGAAEGLQHAHVQGIVHRDLKPSNLILDQGERLRILDFGLARLEGQETLTGSGEFLGTPRYMSPEQARPRGASIDHRTDIYSLGASLFEMLCWRPPFEGRDHQETIQQIINRDPPPLQRLNPRVPRDLETIVLKCLRKEPHERYHTAEALAQDLRRCVRGDPIEARPQPAWEKWARRAWRHRGKVATAALILGLILTLAWVISDSAHKEWQRKIDDYEPIVLRAVMKMQRGRLPLAAEPGERPGTQPEEMVFGFDFQTLVEGAGRDPVDEAVRELEEAAAMLPSRPDAFFHRARGLLVLGRAEEAIEDLARALAADSGFVPARFLRAAILRRQGDREGARSEVVRASSSAAKGWAEVWVSAQLAMAERRWSDAAAAYSTLIESEAAGREPYLGSSAETRLGRGVARLEAGDFPRAIEDFAAARALWLDALEPGLLLGKAYLRAGDRELRELAEETFAGLLERARIPDEAATAIAALYSSLREYDMGLTWADKVREASLRERLRSAMLLQLGRTQEAIEAGRKAVEANPRDAQAYLVLAQAERAAGFQTSGLLKQALEADPKSTHARVLLASELSRQGKLDDARELLRGVIRLEPGSPYGHHALARLLDRRGDPLEAFSGYIRAVEIAPEGIGSHSADGAIRLLKRNDGRRLPIGDLVRALEQALASRPENPAPLLRSLALARIHDPEGRDAVRALDCARLAVEKTAREDPESLAALAEVQFLSGDRAGAVRTIEEAVRLPDAGRRHIEALEEYRRALLPRLTTCASIDAALAAPDIEPLIPEGASWRFFRGKAEPAPDMEWAAPDFDDSSWESGPSGFGYGDAGAATLLDDMPGTYTTIYIRKRFALDDPARFRRVILSVRADDGFVAYLNGVEAGRARAGRAGVRVPFDGTASAWTENPAPEELRLDPAILRAGDNCLAIQGLNSSTGSADLLLVPVLAGELPPEPGKERRLLESLRPAAGGAADGILAAYLEARILERDGEHRRAAERLAAAAAAAGAGAGPEPLLLLAGSLAAAGDPAAAAARLREALAREPRHDRAVWDRWLRIGLVDLELPPADLLAAHPLRDGPAFADGYGSDVLWLLERLAAGEPIRIHCGGEGYRGRAGAEWGKDRFYRGGRPFSDKVRAFRPLPAEIAGTADDPLYLGERVFRPDDIHPPGYRIPLPPGEYRVALHFAEIFHRRRGMRRFDVLLEEKRVIDENEPLTLEFGVAEKRGFEAAVRDGFLDIEFGFVRGDPKISAIEIEAVQRANQ